MMGYAICWDRVDDCSLYIHWEMNVVAYCVGDVGF